jgi:hypothetical protein
MRLRLLAFACTLMLGLAVPRAAEAQRVPDSRFVRAPRLERELRAPPAVRVPIAPQLLGGFAGFVIGGALGFAIADLTDAYYMTAAIDVLGGAAIGTAVGVILVRRRYRARTLDTRDP